MKHLLALLTMLCLSLCTYSQHYDNVINYKTSGVPLHGVKIKTNLPFTNSSQMPTLHFEGFGFGGGVVISVSMAYYIYGDTILNATGSSYGGLTPDIDIANENGKVTILVKSKLYVQRFNVRVNAGGLSAETAANFTNWTAVDSPLISTAIAITPVKYKNKLRGTVEFPGGVMDTTKFTYSGAVCIGCTDPKSYQLAVTGTAAAEKVLIKKQPNWADYVFAPDYKLQSLDSLKQFIQKNRHLPDFPSAEQVKENGVDIGDNIAALLKNIEELTLRVIQQDQEIKALRKAVDGQSKAKQTRMNK